MLLLKGHFDSVNDKKKVPRLRFVLIVQKLFRTMKTEKIPAVDRVDGQKNAFSWDQLYF